MPLGTSATDVGAPTELLELSGDDTVDEFLKGLMPTDAEDPPSGSKEKKDDSDDAATKDAAKDPAEKPEAEADDAEAGEADEKAYADDGAYVKIKVGDEEHEVPVKDLQRLFGQEKALTQKSMEVAAQRTAVDAEMAKNVAATSALLERATQRFEPYSKIDFLLAAKELSTEDYTNLRASAQAAHDDMQFLQHNLNGFMQEAQKRQQDTIVTQAREAVKVLSGPVEKGGIENWTEKLYDDIRTFAVGAGLNQQIVNNLVDPAAISLLNDAMLYRRGKSKVVTTKVNKTPKKVIKTTVAPATKAAPGDKTNVNAALKKLKATGSTDDAAEAMMAGWANNDD